MKKLFLSLAIAAVCFSGCKKEVKHPPVACFTQSATGILAFESVTFTNCSTGGLSYVWNFGDGYTSNEFSPSHTYYTPGTYTVTLNVTNSDGTTNKTSTVTVTAPNSINYAGTFVVSEVCTSGNYNYTVAITSIGVYTISIANFGNFSPTVTLHATISGHNLTIPNQTVTALTFTGAGSASSNFDTLTINYQVNDTASYADDCTSVFIRQ